MFTRVFPTPFPPRIIRFSTFTSHLLPYRPEERVKRGNGEGRVSDRVTRVSDGRGGAREQTATLRRSLITASGSFPTVFHLQH